MNTINNPREKIMNGASVNAVQSMSARGLWTIEHVVINSEHGASALVAWEEGPVDVVVGYPSRTPVMNRIHPFN